MSPLTRDLTNGATFRLHSLVQPQIHGGCSRVERRRGDGSLRSPVADVGGTSGASGDAPMAGVRSPAIGNVMQIRCGYDVETNFWGGVETFPV